MKPKVSIIVPLFNVEKYIHRCIESLLYQTEKNIEIILVNDATPDESMRIVREYEYSDSRIMVIDNQINQGPMWVRMQGCKAASGQYIIFCDSDDELPPDAVEKLADAMDVSNADIVVGQALYVSENSRSYIKSKLSYGTDKISAYKSLLTKEMPQTLWGKMFKSSLFKNYEYKVYKNYTNGEDALMLYQIVQNISKAQVISDFVYYYYQNEGSSTQKKLNEKQINNILTTNEYRISVLSRIPELKNYAFKFVINVIVNFLYRYRDRSMLKNLFTEHHLEKVATLGNILKYFSVKEAAILIYKKYRYFYR